MSFLLRLQVCPSGICMLYERGYCLLFATVPFYHAPSCRTVTDWPLYMGCNGLALLSQVFLIFSKDFYGFIASSSSSFPIAQ